MKRLLFFATLIGSITLTAQEHEHGAILPCSVNLQAEEAYQADPSLKTQDSLDQIAFEIAYQDYLQNEYDPNSRSSYVIPIVFHVVHEGGEENISDEQIYDAIAKLNEDYDAANSDLSAVIPAFQGIIGNCDIEFRLATRDPNGQCHPGITRTFSQYTFDDGSGQTMSAVAAQHGVWPQNKYLNVFVVSDPNGAAGYTNYPAGWYPPNSMEGGIYLRHDYCGTIGTGSTSTRRTISHECAHWLNIRHVWGNSNDITDPNNCTEDDLVGDTPVTQGNNGCDLTTQSCGSLDNVQNNMDYTGSCRRMFTQGQVARMHTALNSSTADRDNLWTNANLIATGTDGLGDLCVADFSSDIQVICAGSTVSFFDESYHNVTSRNWTFSGGTPANSTAQDPVVTYTTGGIYPVTLEVSDGSAVMNETKTAYIVVIDDPGSTPPYSEGFEGLSTIPDNSSWFVVNGNAGNAWTLANVGADNTAKSASLQNYGNTDGSTDELISESIDLSGVQASDQIVFNFEFAYNKRTSGNNELLQFYISKDCGETWVLRKNISGSALGDIISSGPYTPSSVEDWVYQEVTNINADYFVSNFRFKFVFTNDGGNNIYIDNINLYPASMSDLKETAVSSSILFPNPATDQATLILNESDGKDLTISLVNSLGQEVNSFGSQFFAAGSHQMNIDLRAVEAGIYFVKITSDEASELIKLVKK